MNKLLPLLLAGALRAAAQTTDTPADLVKTGVALYDAGKYDEAVASYQQALKQAPGDVLARTELALTYNALGRNSEAAALCQQLIKENPEIGPSVYVTLGNSLDASKKPVEALAAYRLGIKQFPSNYNLYFNEGVTLTGQGKLAEASGSFQRAVQLNPRHASSHMLLGAVQLQQGNRIPGLLALARFLVLEPNSPRSPQRRQWLDQAMTLGVSQQDSTHVTINIAAGSLDKKHKNKPDDFGMEEMTLSLAAATSLTKESPAKSATEKFILQFQTLCQLLAEQQGNANGFTRTYYVPYFVALEKKGFVPAFAYLAHTSQADAPAVQQWLAAHPNEVQVFLEWSKNYEWK